MTITAVPREFSPYRISELSFWAKTAEEREATFAKLRAESPISWQPMIEGALVPSEKDGVWAVTSHELVTYVSKNPQLFASGQGHQMEDVPEDIYEASSSFLAMDAPRHPIIRKLVSSAFTPKRVATIKDQVDRQASSIVDGLLANPEGDFVQRVSKRLPMWTIYEMIGLEDPEKRDEAAHRADEMVSWADVDVAGDREPGEVLNDGLVGLLTLGLELMEERRSNPKDDLMSALVTAEVDGVRLTDDEIGAFFVLLSVAGNDTTRNSISLTARALQQFPDQRQLLVEDFDGRIGVAIEEFVRWATPVMTFRRTATQDCELGGARIKEGDWIAMIYSAANRDEKAFEAPGTFNVLRDPNPHVGFGGGGPHFCMGNFVAKMQLRAIFRELLFRAPTLQLGEPDYLTGNFVRAVKSMPYTLG